MMEEQGGFCAQCGGSIMPGEQFCGACGAPVAAEEPTPRSAPAPETDARPTPTPAQAPPRAVDNEARGGERRIPPWPAWGLGWALAWAVGAAAAGFVALASLGGSYAIFGHVSTSAALSLLLAASFGVAGFVAGTVSGLALHRLTPAGAAVAGWTLAGTGIAWVVAFTAAGLFGVRYQSDLPSGSGELYGLVLPALLVLVGTGVGLLLALVAAGLTNSPVAPVRLRAVKIVAAWGLACGLAGIAAAVAVTVLGGEVSMIRIIE